MANDDKSFDPRTWLKLEPDAVPAEAPPEVPRAPRQRLSRLQWAAAGSIVVLVLGALAAGLSRRGPSPPAGSTMQASRTAASVPSLSRRSLVLPNPAALRSALLSADLAPAEADSAAKAALGALGNGIGPIHVVLTLEARGGKHMLQRLEVSFDDSSGAAVTRGAEGAFTATHVQPSLTSTIHVVRGEMDAESFYSSAVAAGVIDSLVSEIARALAFDFDFQREIKPGDVFEVAWEQEVNAQQRPVGIPHLRFVSLVTAEKSRSLYWFQPPGGEGGWYDGNGASVVRTLMRTPVDGARVTSGFGYRLHPILGFMKLHKGTDFAAPIGTPIFASGDGVVEWAAMKGPNGNLTILRHDNGWETYYLHQSMFMPGVAPGARVIQGQKIGEIGTTGRSTGPHLHYEVHIDGQAVDPMSIKTESAKTLEGAERGRFIQERDRIDVSRARAAG